MQSKKILTTLAVAMMLFVTIQSCHSSYDEGSEEGHYDTVQQNRSNDRTMSNQQHDGTLQPKTDTAAGTDTTMVQ